MIKTLKIQGFTLLEVLVALMIVGVALMAAMRALGNITDQHRALSERMIASWMAHEYLTKLRLTQAWPEVGQKDFACRQGSYTFVCEEIVATTVNPSFRRIQINVYKTKEKQGRLTSLITLQANQSRRSL